MDFKEQLALLATGSVAVGVCLRARRSRPPVPKSSAPSASYETSSRNTSARRVVAETSHVPSIAETSESIVTTLKRHQPVTIDGMEPTLHYLAPHVAKVRWTALGDLVASREKQTNGTVDGSRWMSLRLDGSGFSKATRTLRSKGVLEPGFSSTFAEAMQSTLRALFEHFHGCVGYTQSDEITLLIPPASVVRGEQQQHMRNGRVTKTASLAAGFATAHFLMELTKRCLEKGVALDGLAHVRPHFDCRIGSFDSFAEARALLIWRAYDCSVNGVSDAVYHIPGSGKQVQSLGKREKIEWLWSQGHLPLPRHQAYGTTLVRVKRLVDGVNQKTGEQVQCLRSVVEQRDGSLLELVRTDALQLQPDNERVFASDV